MYLGYTPISWKSGKQRIVLRSSTEVEYKALADDTIDILWIRSLMLEFRVLSSAVTTLWCDNLGAVEVDYHFVHDCVTKREIQVRFIFSKDQLVDVLTKPLPPISFAYFRSKLRVESPPSA